MEAERVAGPEAAVLEDAERPKSTGSSSSAVQCCTVTQRDGVVIFSCKFPGCGREYASRDAVRKHCRLRHLDWLRSLDKGVAVEHQLVRPDKKRPKGAAQQEANAARSSDEEEGEDGAGGKKKRRIGPGGRPYWASDALDESDQALRGALSLPEDANLNDFEVSPDDLFQAVQEGLGVDGGDAELLLTGIASAEHASSQGGAAARALAGESDDESDDESDEGEAGREGETPAVSRAMLPPPAAASGGSAAPATSAMPATSSVPTALTPTAAAPAPGSPPKWPPLPPQLPPGARACPCDT